MEELLGVLFRDGPSGRRAVLIGGPDVWEVIRVVRSVRSAEPELDIEGIVGLAVETTGLPPGRVRVVLDYWAAYPDEYRAADPRRRRGRTRRRSAVATGAAAAVVNARLLLDEMFSPEIASELVRRGTTWSRGGRPGAGRPARRAGPRVGNRPGTLPGHRERQGLRPQAVPARGARRGPRLTQRPLPLSHRRPESASRDSTANRHNSAMWR